MPRNKVFRRERLKQMREMRGLSQDDLADRLGFGASQMNRYETGKSEPSPDIIKRLALELEVTTDWLLGLSDEKAEHFQQADISAQEWEILKSYRRADLEAYLRLGLEKRKPGDGHPPGKPQPE